MKRNKKIMAAALTGALVLGLLSGCAGNGAKGTTAGDSAGAGTETKKTESKESSGEKVTLRFMWWGGDTRNEATLAVIDQYMKEHPNVVIEAEMNSSDGYIDKTSTMLANGTAPDIMQQNVDAMPDYVSRGDFFVNISDYPQIFDASGFDKEFIGNFGTWDGKLLALPTGVSCLSTVADENAAKTCNVDLTKQLTWNSILEEGKRVHEENPDYYLFNVDTKLLCEYVLRPYLRQLTGKSFIMDDEKKMSFTKDQLVEVLTYIKNGYDEGVFQPASESATFKEAIQTNPKWIDGKFVLAFAPSSGINLLTEADPNGQYTVVQMPMMENRVNDGYFADTPQYLTVNKKSEHVEEALDFLNYFYNSEKAAETLKDVRSIPPVASSRKVCTEKGLLNENVVKAVDLSMGLNGKSDKGLTTSSEVYAIQEDMIESIAYGQSTPEEAADNAIDLIEDYLSVLQ